MADRRTRRHYDEIDDIRSDITSLRDHVRNLSRTLGEDVRLQTNHQIQNASIKSRKAMRNVENQVREHPGQSLLLAFAGGLLASVMFRRG